MTTPALAIDIGGERFYELDGNRYESVTNVIGSTLPKDGLIKWSNRLCVDASLAGKSREDALRAAEDTRDESGRVGDEVHAHAEQIMLDPELRKCGHELAAYIREIDDRKVRSRVESFASWVQDFQPEPVFVEATVFSDTHGYAGSCDLFCTLPAHPDMGVVCVDYKTSKSVYPTVALQTAAYAHADFVVTSDGEALEMPLCSVGAVLHIKARSYEFKRLDIGAVTRDCFLTLLDTKRFWLGRHEAVAVLGQIKP